MSDTVYVYGFVPRGAALPEHGLAGIADRDVELVDLERVSAAVSQVPGADYSPEAIESRSEDLRWVAAQGVAHERVVAWFVDHAEIMPVRLFTLYSSADALRAETRERVDEVADALDRFAGLREWDLKVAYSAERLEEHLGELSDQVAALDTEIDAAGPGKGFLLRKKRADLVEGEARRAARRLAAELLDALRELAADSETLPLPQDAAELPVVLNAALLIESDEAELARAEVERRAGRLEGLGMQVVFSGPWAPYRFIGMDHDADTGSATVGGSARAPGATGAG